LVFARTIDLAQITCVNRKLGESHDCKKQHEPGPPGSPWQIFASSRKIFNLLLEEYRTQGQTEELLAFLDRSLEEILKKLQEFKDTPNLVPDITTRPFGHLISEVLNWEIERLPGITTTSFYILRDGDIKTILQLAGAKRKRLQKLPGNNEKRLTSLEHGLAVLGLRFQMSPEEIKKLPSTIPHPTIRTLSKKIAELEFGKQTADLLKTTGVETVKQLVAKTEQQLRREGFQTRSIVEIKNLLAELGLWIGMTETEITVICLNLPNDDVLQYFADHLNDDEPTAAE